MIHSCGGHFAYPVIKNRREQIRSVTFFESVFFHLLRQEDNPLFSQPTGMSKSYRAAMVDGDLDRAMASFVDVWARKDGTWAGMPDAVKDKMTVGAERVYHEWMIPWFDEPDRGDLAALDLPVLLFEGGATLASMHRVCEILRETLPDCRYAKIDGAGHMSPFTHAKIALPEIRKFLAEVG